MGLDIMDLPSTEQRNKHVVVFQDMFAKWPMVFPVPDQKAERTTVRGDFSSIWCA